MVTVGRGHDGFSRANTAALARAQGDRIGRANPDLERSPDLIRSLRRHLDEHPEAGLVTCREVDSEDRPQGLHRALPSLVPVFFCRTAAKSRLRAAVVRRHPRLFGWRRVLGAQLRAARATAGAALRRTGAGPRSAAAAGGSER